MLVSSEREIERERKTQYSDHIYEHRHSEEELDYDIIEEENNFGEDEDGDNEMETFDELFTVKHWESFRVGRNEWCKCDNCKTETREIECLCCTEVDALTDKQFQGIKCITKNEDFKQLCLVLICLHETRGKFLQDTPTNKSFRFAAYKQFI
ncbi:uncharacterized protein LOC130629868 [Hydractinia symbiolongicarpus]|uniref:uncharacterized protein LOC130629868 n=1 Tax=Hydractinia symbiolongicarpus TaxID=13093 RepID=UPI00254F35A6|nr:uncharacterized protein LOC130629868 [Hydractinia symbiolongicarpus]